MIDLGTSQPTTENFMEAMSRLTAQAREAVDGMELLARQYVNGEVYITEEEAAEILKCNTDKIPVRVPRYIPVMGNGYLYKRGEVIDFIESKRVNKVR